MIDISGGTSSKVTSLIIFDTPLFPAISVPSIFISYDELLVKLTSWSIEIPFFSPFDN